MKEGFGKIEGSGLGVFDALLEDLSSVPITHKNGLQLALTPDPGHLTPRFWPPGLSAHNWHTYTHADTHSKI